MINGSFDDSKSLQIRGNYKRRRYKEIELILVGYVYNLDRVDVIEFIVESYLKQGLSFFQKLDGCFTILIYSEDETLIVRDRHGLHSQIYYNKSLFSSSLYDLLNDSSVDRNPNYQSLASFLSAGHISGSVSSIIGISKLAAGNVLKYSSKHGFDNINLFKSSDVEAKINDEKSLETYAEEFYSLHKKAIERRIRNANRIGLFLSGGYDSGANLLALREQYEGDIYTYSIGFKGSEISELPQARLMAETTNSIHHEYSIDGSEIKFLPTMLRHFGDPFAECGMMVNHSVFGLAGENFNGVLIGGEGNDHYFSTANRQIAISHLISKYRLKRPLSAIKRILDSDRFDKDGLLFRANFHLETSLNIIQGEMFGFPRWQVPKFLKDKSYSAKSPKLDYKFSDYDDLYLQHVLLTDIEKNLNRIILFKSSKIAQMYNSHIAYPFVDLEIYNFLINLPNKYKCKGDSIFSIARGRGTSKYLHKHIYAPKMPKLIAQKPKQGGFVPMEIFFKDAEQRRRLNEIVLDSSLFDDFLKKDEVEKFLKTFNTEINDSAKWFWYRQIKCNQMFNLVSIAIWWEEFIKNRSISI